MADKEKFNPNDVGVANGRYFGMPFENKECPVVLISVPWDATVSYSEGTAKAPSAIIDASIQVDLFDEYIKGSENIKIGTDESTIEVDSQLIRVEDYIAVLNEYARRASIEIIDRLSSGKPLTQKLVKSQKEVNQISEEINTLVETLCTKYYQQKKIPGVVGGEHSVAFGAIKAAVSAQKKGTKLGLLQIDAHADLRKCYEGFEYSHASVMYNALEKIEGIESLVQVGIRDFCSDESEYAKKQGKIIQFTDNQMTSLLFEGKSWKSICQKISSSLPKNVYLSFDIDGLQPDLCPNTGTPVPGGLTWQQAIYLLRVIGENHNIVGFDLNEVAPDKENKNEWDANVGARLLHKISLIVLGKKLK